MAAVVAETGGIFSVISDIALKVFKKTTFIHEFYTHKNNMHICFGIKIKNLFSAIVKVKSREKITIITFNLNGYKYKLYLATGKILTAVRMTMLYIKGKLTKDAKLLRKLNAVTLNKKEYKRMKLNKKKIINAMDTKIKMHKKPVPDDELATGPLVIKFGRTGEDPRFDEMADAM